MFDGDADEAVEGEAKTIEEDLFDGPTAGMLMRLDFSGRRHASRSLG